MKDDRQEGFDEVIRRFESLGTAEGDAARRWHIGLEGVFSSLESLREDTRKMIATMREDDFQGTYEVLAYSSMSMAIDAAAKILTVGRDALTLALALGEDDANDRSGQE